MNVLTVIVWVLIIPAAYSKPAVQLGPYADEASCEKVRRYAMSSYSDKGTCASVSIFLPQRTAIPAEK